MKKQNERESLREKEGIASDSMENDARNGSQSTLPNQSGAENAVYDVYMLTDSVPVKDVYDGEKHYLTLDDLLLHSGNDIFGEEFLYEGE